MAIHWTTHCAQTKNCAVCCMVASAQIACAYNTDSYSDLLANKLKIPTFFVTAKSQVVIEDVQYGRQRVCYSSWKPAVHDASCVAAECKSSPRFCVLGGISRVEFHMHKHHTGIQSVGVSGQNASWLKLASATSCYINAVNWYPFPSCTSKVSVSTIIPNHFLGFSNFNMEIMLKTLNNFPAHFHPLIQYLVLERYNIVLNRH